MRRSLVLPLLLLLFTLACGGNTATGPSPSSTPTPTPTPTATPAPSRILNITGDLNYGNIDLGTFNDRTITLSNSGTVALTVSSVTSTADTSVLTVSWTSGTIAPGANQIVTVRFTPTARQYYAGTLSVQSDQTAFAVNGARPAFDTIQGDSVNWWGYGVDTSPLWAASGTSEGVFTMPTTVTKVKITGDYTASRANFIVHIAGTHFVNEQMGTDSGQTHFESTYTTDGGVVEILSSIGVRWTFTEVR
jgi:hypothetical protein